MDSLATLLEEAAEALSEEGGYRPSDVSRALSCIRIARGRLDNSPINRASRLLYSELDAWFQGAGTVRVEVVVQLLAEEGLLRDEREDDDAD